MTRSQKYEQLLCNLRKKTTAQLNKELRSWRRHLDKHRDTFFHESPPEELTDGDRVLAIREILDERSAAANRI